MAWGDRTLAGGLVSGVACRSMCHATKHDVGWMPPLCTTLKSIYVYDQLLKCACVCCCRVGVRLICVSVCGVRCVLRTASQCYFGRLSGLVSFPRGRAGRGARGER